jgi:hypothetical protein
MCKRFEATDNAPPTMGACADSLLDEMRRLADGARSARALPQIERALADGCARKLGVEAERLRLERRLRDVVTGRSGRSLELPCIARLLARTESELSVLRDLIALLRVRQRALQAG